MTTAELDRADRRSSVDGLRDRHDRVTEKALDLRGRLPVIPLRQGVPGVRR